MASRRIRRQGWTASASHAAAGALAGWLCIKGGDIRSIQELLYKSDLRTTTIYK